MEDVAREAGVSRALVSLVMRQQPNVSADRRRRVLEAAGRLGYRPNAMARSLASRRTRTVGVMLDDLRNPFFAEIASGVEELASELGYQLLLGSGGRLARRESSALATLLEYRVDGVILVSPRMAAADIAAACSEVPVVIVGRRLRNVDADFVVNDERHGAAIVLDHLLQLGHERIAHVDGGRGAGGPQRRSSYLRGMRDRRLADRARVIPGDFTEEAGTAAARLLLAERELPTAVFAANDLIAAGLLGELDRAGVAVPGDVSIVGYDNISIAHLAHVSLTTVDQPRNEMGRLALRAAAGPDRAASGRRRAADRADARRALDHRRPGLPSLTREEMTMARSAATLVAPHQLEVREYPYPTALEPGAVLLRMLASGICGTDKHTFRGETEQYVGTEYERSTPFPIIQGHENVGIVEAIGDGGALAFDGTALATGDRVVPAPNRACGHCHMCARGFPYYLCRRLENYGNSLTCAAAPHLFGGWSQFLYLKPRTAVFRVPATLPDEIAVLTEIFAVTHSLERAAALPRPNGWRPGDAVVVNGVGALGLAHAIKASLMGAGRVLVIDPSARRRELAARLADAVALVPGPEAVAAVRAATGGEGADLVVNATGFPGAFAQAEAMVRDGGTIVEVGAFVDMGGESLTRRRYAGAAWRCSASAARTCRCTRARSRCWIAISGRFRSPRWCRTGLM